MQIIETDNFGGDYPNEVFINLPFMTPEHAKKVADAINEGFNQPHFHCSRYWRVVDNDYVLQPGFEP